MNRRAFVILLMAWRLRSFPCCRGLIHLLLVFAVISLILHFILGNRQPGLRCPESERERQELTYFSTEKLRHFSDRKVQHRPTVPFETSN